MTLSGRFQQGILLIAGSILVDGSFDADLFRDKATNDQVKMIEIKLSQGAKHPIFDTELRQGWGITILPRSIKKLRKLAGFPRVFIGGCRTPSSHLPSGSQARENC